jgi:hypothetical protein
MSGIYRGLTAPKRRANTGELPSTPLGRKGAEMRLIVTLVGLFTVAVLVLPVRF